MAGRRRLMRFVAIGGAALHTAFRPPQNGAPTLVFANSLGTDFRIWQPVVDLLPARLGILLYDKRSHGLSERTTSDAALASHIGDLAGLVAEAGIGRHVVCGLSVGGLIALGYALGRPEGLAGLILSNTAGRIGDTAMWDERIAAVRQGGLEAIGDRIMERWFSPEFRMREPATYAGMRTMLVRQDPGSYADICTMLRDTDLRPTAPTLALATLAIAGSRDLSTPPDLVRGTAEMITGAEFTVIEGVGHIPCVEAPDVYAARLEAFLAAHDLLGV